MQSKPMESVKADILVLQNLTNVVLFIPSFGIKSQNQLVKLRVGFEIFKFSDKERESTT